MPRNENFYTAWSGSFVGIGWARPQTNHQIFQFLKKAIKCLEKQSRSRIRVLWVLDIPSGRPQSQCSFSTSLFLSASPPTRISWLLSCWDVNIGKHHAYKKHLHKYKHTPTLENIPLVLRDWIKTIEHQTGNLRREKHGKRFWEPT